VSAVASLFRSCRGSPLGSRLELRRSLLLGLLIGLSAPSFGQAPKTTSSWTIFEPHAADSAAPLVAKGEIAYQARCHLCHGRLTRAATAGFGTRMAGTEALEAKYGGRKPGVLEDRTDLTPEVVKYFVRHGSGIMPFFRKTEVSDADLDAIAAYLCRTRAK
jgi:(+)-pinoresinol hydroxylase